MLLFHSYTLYPLLFKKASKDMGVLANKCVVYSLRRSRTFERAVQLSALLKCTLYTSLHKWNMSICTLFFIIVALFDTKISLYFGFSDDVIIDVLSWFLEKSCCKTLCWSQSRRWTIRNSTCDGLCLKIKHLYKWKYGVILINKHNLTLKLTYFIIHFYYLIFFLC